MRSGGQQIAFSATQIDQAGQELIAPRIFLIDIDSGLQTALTSSPARAQFPSWSPNGNQIAFHGGPGASDVFAIDADGGDLINLTSHRAADARADWSPNGNQIAFQSNRDGNLEIYVMNGDGSEPTRLTEHAGRALDPAWSPNGHKITFDRDIEPIQEQIRQQFVMDADGSNPHALTGLPSENGHGCWGRGPALVP